MSHTLSHTIICLNCRKQLSYVDACVNFWLRIFFFYATRFNNPNKYNVDDLWQGEINFCRSNQFFVTILKRSISVHSKSENVHYFGIIIVVGLVVWHSWSLCSTENCVSHHVRNKQQHVILVTFGWFINGTKSTHIAFGLRLTDTIRWISLLIKWNRVLPHFFHVLSSR